MRVRSVIRIFPVLLVLLPGARAALAQDCAVPLLMRGADGFLVEFAPVAANQVRVFAPGTLPALITPILPLSAGLSGDLVRHGTASLVSIRCIGGEVRVSLRGADGSTRDLPAVPIANYARYALRVNVTDDQRRGTAFLVRDGVVARDDGPVLDMFRGRVPMAAGDVAVTIEVREPVATAAGLAGTWSVTALGPWPAVAVSLPGGRTARFVLDLGATRTAVHQSLLPEGTPVHDLVAVEHSSRGTRQLDASAMGAGGAAASVGRTAELPWLRVGDVRVDSVRPLVMDAPLVAGHDTILGVIGLDVLRRAGRVRGSFAAGTGTLVLGGPPLAAAGEIPLREVQGLLFANGRVGEASLLWLLDSGSRLAAVPAGLADRMGWVRRDGPVDSLRGIDGAPFVARRAEPPPVVLGGWQAPAFRFVAADFPVLRAVGLAEPAGVLGQPFFQAVGEIEIDFERGVLRVPRR